jgi:ABC-type Fe3+/spermidine/putrescine transport system ATPase subunit
MVFQSYALFPHMTVAANVSFGLRMRGLPRPEIEQRVKQALTLLGIDALADRYPRQLSGGQQQRVAVARALVMQPKFLLFDEPLSNLDAKLRERMRFEIKALQRRLGITSIYVTHDQAEALVISDRVAVMNDGQLAQVGTPHEIYNNPLSTFVAGFIGLTNFLPGHVTAQRPSGYYEVATSAGPLLCRSHRAVDPGVQVKVSIRPENIMLYSDSAIVDTQNQLRGRVLQCIYMGNLSDYQVEVASDTVLRVQIQGQPLFAVGTNVQIAIVPDSCLIHLE